MTNDTIVAVSTADAKSAIAMVRLSGDDALEIASRVFRSLRGKSLSDMPGYTAAYGTFYDGDEMLDEGVALVMRAPRSYTGESLAELSCHGNPEIAARLLRACVRAGARSAGRGEFTRRAFENGKIDLTQAEAIAELIEAEGDAARRAALRRKNGAVGERVDSVCEALSLLAAKLAVWSDYPEETDAPVLTPGELSDAMREQRTVLEALAAGHRAGQYLQNGIRVAIVGRPNVGKSTLLNRLTGEERAIVTSVAGTTRDVLEAPAQLGGMRLRLLDTAGIRDADDEVEQIGVTRAKKALCEADLVLLVLDAESGLSDADRELLAEVTDRPHVIVANKTDLPHADIAHIGEKIVEISAKTGAGIEALSDAVCRVLGMTQNEDAALIAGERQYGCVLQAISALSEAEDALADGVTLDAAGILLDEAIGALGELTGKTASDLTLEQVFSHFCVGK